MNRAVVSGWVVAVVMSVWAPVAKAAAHLQFIDMGTPRNGAVVMNGWRGVVVRVSLDDGLPITRIDLGADGISGGMAQRWTDPSGQGNYTQTSPGPISADNAFDSDFNFDSHLLGTPEMLTVVPPAPAEGIPAGFNTSRTGLPSDAFVGYVAPPVLNYDADPILLGLGGKLVGRLNVNPGFQAGAIDAAYIVTDSRFAVDGVAYSGTQGFGFGTGYRVPEPSGLAVWLIGAISLVTQRGGRPTAPGR